MAISREIGDAKRRLTTDVMSNSLVTSTSDNISRATHPSKPFQLLLSALLLPLFMFRPASGIVCYQCDALSQPKSDCPGWNRRPVDTFRDLHDKGGLYTHCVDIRLANGTILHQGPYPESPTCARDFRLVWRTTLEKRYRQRIRLRCCETNMCNVASALPRTSPLLVFIALVFWEPAVRWRKSH